ncbi:MAG TPA: DsbA family protein [Longimicrobium sp.]|nr:DsbA family protein [Longimicrobium sp.]
MPRPAPKTRRNNPLLPFYVLLGVAALAGAFFLFRQMQGSGGDAATTLQEVVMTPEQLQRVPGISKGQPNAPVVIMEFADFQCPGCGEFARYSEPLLNDHIAAGTVRFVWYDYPLVEIHANALLAARAGRCANDQNQFWGYHDHLFGQQLRWADEKNPVSQFIEYAEQAGLDRNTFAQCLRSDKYQKEVSESRQLGGTLGVNGTPTLFVNGKRVQNTPKTRAEWDELIRQEAGGAPAATAPATPGATAPAAGTASPAGPASSGASVPPVAAPADSAG